MGMSKRLSKAKSAATACSMLHPVPLSTAKAIKLADAEIDIFM